MPLEIADATVKMLVLKLYPQRVDQQTQCRIRHDILVSSLWAINIVTVTAFVFLPLFLHPIHHRHSLLLYVSVLVSILHSFISLVS
jgi:hypothetical protein